MLSSMTLAEIQAKYSGIHTPEDIEQFHQNMTNSKKWKIVKNEWTWDGLNQAQLRGLHHLTSRFGVMKCTPGPSRK